MLSQVMENKNGDLFLRLLLLLGPSAHVLFALSGQGLEHRRIPSSLDRREYSLCRRNNNN
jgi:hypothetical protein